MVAFATTNFEPCVYGETLLMNAVIHGVMCTTVLLPHMWYHIPQHAYCPHITTSHLLPLVGLV